MNEKIWSLVGGQDAQYPHALEARHPHVIQKIAELWDDPAKLDHYFETLMITEPGRERQGFAPAIVVEIFRLQQLHMRVHPAKTTPKENPWELIRIDKQPETLALQVESAKKKLVQGFFQCAGCDECSPKNDCLAVIAYLRQGVPIDSVDEGGLTALMMASFKGNAQIVEQLLRLDADVTIKAEGGYSAIHWAALGGNCAVLQLLLDHRADVNALTRFGLSPLLQAATNGHRAACALLIEHGASVNQATREGWTPLHKACANGHIEVVRLLIGHGADREARNPAQNVPSPLELAIKNKRNEIVELISS